MDFTTNFINGIIAIVVAIIVLALVAVPILSQALSNSGMDSNLVSILEVIPVFLGIAILYASVKMFLSKRGEAY